MPDGVIDETDFIFRVGNDNDPSGWSAAPPPESTIVREDAGANGSDRITVIWNDGSITQQWLQVTVLANTDTDLPRDDVFYYGNPIAEINGVPANGQFVFDAADIDTLNVSGQYGQSGQTVNSPVDFDRDGSCSGVDIQIILSEYGSDPYREPAGGWLQQISVPAVVSVDDFYAAHNLPGDELRVDYTIANDPAATLNSLWIRLYVSLDGVTPAGDPILEHEASAAERGAGSHTVSFDPDVPELGYEHYLMAVVEGTEAAVTRPSTLFEGAFLTPQGTVCIHDGDTGYTDTGWTDAVRIVPCDAAPTTDIVITGFSTNEDHTELRVQYDVALGNADAFEIGIYTSPDGMRPEELLMTHRVTDTGLLTPDGHTLDFPADFYDVQGDYYLIAKVDAYCEVLETEESNNRALLEYNLFLGGEVVYAYGGDVINTVFVGVMGSDLVVGVDGIPGIFPVASVSEVNIRMHGGDDIFLAYAPLDVPLLVYGGDGNDTFPAETRTTHSAAATART